MRFFILFLLLSSSVVFADSYKIDSVHSSVIFSIRHFSAGNFFGMFKTVSGEFSFDENDVSKNSISVEVKSDSVFTNNDGRDKHVKSEDFFNVNKYPTITFKSTKCEKTEKGYKITGELSFHGVTKEITAQGEFGGIGKGMKGETRCGVEARFTIKRSDFGMNFMVGPLSDDVKLIVSVEGIAGK